MSESLGPFFSFPLEGSTKDDIGSVDVLKSILTDSEAGRLEFLQGDFAPASVSTSPAVQGCLQPFVPTPFPASRFEVVAENNNNNALGFRSFQQEAAGIGRQDGSSSGGTQPDSFAVLGVEHNGNTHRERNRAAQKKFRERQKARVANNNKRLEDLERRMAQLLQEKRGLESQNKLLQHTVMVNTTHYTELQAQQQAYEIQQEVLLMDTARIYRRGLNRPDLTLEDTKQFTMDGFLNVFEHFIGRYRMLLNSGGMDPNSQANKELEELASARRLEEARIALFSRWSSATLAWNREETRNGLQPPSLGFYTDLLANLQVSPEQQQEWLAARRRLLEQLADIRRRREKVALSLGLLLLQKRKPDGQTPEERQLRDSLEEEREAVLAFLYNVIDCNLTPTQEAVMDVFCHPWWPCIWTLCNLLASKQKKEPPDTLVEEGSQTSLFPQFSAAELLKEPLLARMGGLQLKRTIISVPTPENVLEAASTPAPTIASMRSMTVFEVMCGKHLEGLVPRM